MAEPRSLPSDAVERLLAAANGDAALLYLHFAAGRPLENAREALRMSEARYDLACATLQQLGLWPQEPQRHLDASQAPVYTEQDVIRETHTSREFEAITGETQRRLGRVLSNEELKILLSIYRYLGLPGEVISILVNYCIQRQRSRGISRMPSLRSIEKEAYYWADHGIDTMEQAAVYMQNQLLRQSQLGKIRELFGLTGRRLTPGEEQYILTWLSWGFGEQEIGHMTEQELKPIRLHMGMVFQYSALFDSMTVGDNVAFGLREHTDLSEARIADIVREKLHLVGLDGVEDLMPGELSGGMKKRVSLARAIAIEPSIIFYDEPSSGLDPIMTEKIDELIIHTQRALHVTSVVVTHDMASACRIADRIAMIYEGELIAVDTAERFQRLKDPRVQAFFHTLRTTKEVCP